MIQPLNYYSRVVTGCCNCITKASSSSIRIFFNPQLFLSGFKNFHVHTYPNSKRICASTRIRIQSITLPSRLLSRLVPIRRLSRPFSVNAFRQEPIKWWAPDFGDVSETNGRETPRQSQSAHAWAFTHVQLNDVSGEYPSLKDRHWFLLLKNKNITWIGKNTTV